VKRVEFYSKNKFEELVHFVGFIIIIHHDAWSPESQIRKFLSHRAIDTTPLGFKNQSVNFV